MRFRRWLTWGVGIQKNHINEKCEMEVQLFGKSEQLNKKEVLMDTVLNACLLEVFYIWYRIQKFYGEIEHKTGVVIYENKIYERLERKSFESRYITYQYNS